MIQNSDGIIDCDRRTLPMRNWHHHADGFLTGIYPMDSRTLPMRNWHLKYFIDGWIVWKPQIDRRTLPMRNWHRFSKTISPFILETHVGHYLWGIDTISPHILRTRLLSDITYEELTPSAYSQSSSSVASGRTLPMRNWHLLHHQMHLLHSVGHYLWGIDT